MIVETGRGPTAVAVLAAILVGVLVACTAPPAEAPLSRGLPLGTLVVESDRGPVRIRVEIAERWEDRVRGLREVRHLPRDAGMVFLPEAPARQVFVMEDTLIPLSIAFWDATGRIVSILEMDPCPGAPCPHYDPGVRSAGAVEVNQGFFEDHGIEVGDRVHLERTG